MTKNDDYLLGLDTLYVLAGDYNRRDILGGFNDRDVSTPLFDSLAADRFASDRANKAEKHFHIWSDMPCFCVDEDDEFNLGDYR